ncbi:Eukaryotic translation initiation factor 3 subunit B (eIF3b) (Eukaryotic translation initiation factor 3 subunit 9) (eIF-3-eta) (eIF3 p116) [Durusdinium trenchii]|uniref:Eukaryotic translation initiation factor 3 subunit B (eIF3b) (Eukaryotic translation initiation factor 3 subunit 9) (eIF-3-eta) (eIF3 p116) n=1 Tax=Durusdinium trenchii TaxID=1381693 RepID=A0ABP0JL81_9DINO
MCNEFKWDPSGRIVATIVTQPMFGSVAMKYQLENGYNLWSFQGQPLRKEKMEHFYQFLWRPRPKTTLTEDEIAKVTRGIKGYMARYGKEDEIRRKRMEAAANKEKIEALTNFRNLVERRTAECAELDKERKRLGLLLEEDDSGFEIMEEEEEQFVSERVEPFF